MHLHYRELKQRKNLAAQPGLEPGTNRLTVDYSTIELLGSKDGQSGWLQQDAYHNDICHTGQPLISNFLMLLPRRKMLQ